MQRRAIHTGYNDDAKVVLRGQGAEDGSLDAGDNHEASGHEESLRTPSLPFRGWVVFVMYVPLGPSM